MISRRTFDGLVGAGLPVFAAGPAIVAQAAASEASRAPRTKPGAPGIGKGPRSTDVKIEELVYEYEEHRYRTPYKFGAAIVNRTTLLNVYCTVSNRAGKWAQGYGSMVMGNMWSWPAPGLSYDATLNAMKALADKLAKLTRDYPGYAHPLDINRALEPEYLKAAAEIKVGDPVPKLCTLVVASPFDAAIHDAFGKLYAVNAFNGSGKEFVKYDLSHYLNKDFRGEYLDPYVLPKPLEKITIYHSVGGLDPLTAADVKKPIGDGLPEILADWIRYNGIRALKIKLAGNNLAWDVDRVVSIDRIAEETQTARGLKDWMYCVDFNERCPNVQYVLDFIHQVNEKAPRAFARITYLEQPTARDLAHDRANVMFEAAKLKPVVIDESLTGLDMLLLARDMGYSGIAMKACKGQSQSLLLGAAAQKYKMFRCVQDLTCPGASLIHSAGLASHVPGTGTIESNGRQYVPAANQGWEDRFPGIFKVKDGYMRTYTLNRPGLAAI
jgi:L-alanine-DL-glutamate epimerase-like enolase superfamily enzyme